MDITITRVQVTQLVNPALLQAVVPESLVSTLVLPLLVQHQGDSDDNTRRTHGDVEDVARSVA